MKLQQHETELFGEALKKVFGAVAAESDFTEKTLSGSRLLMRDFDDGEIIYERAHTLSALGFLISGSAEVVRKKDGGEVFLRVLQSGDAFGAALLFANECDYCTSVRASGKTRVIFMSQALAEDIMIAYPRAAIGYITFLSEKIRFLNRKLETFTSDSANEKLARYILREAGERDSFTPRISYSLISDTLGLGRASLYRAIDALCANGAIQKEHKKIYITDRGKLLRETGGKL